jgi:hypothetical protein
VLERPLRLESFERQDRWEGQVGDAPQYLARGLHDTNHYVEVRLYFGGPDPAPALLAEAQAMLDGLELPDWGPWKSTTEGARLRRRHPGRAALPRARLRRPVDTPELLSKRL